MAVIKEKPKIIKRLPKKRAMEAVAVAAPVEADFDDETPDEGVRLHRWTLEEYHRLGELGMFEGRRVELIEGEICEMSPMATPHAAAIMVLDEVFGEVLQRRYGIRCQLPMTMPNATEPEPDFAIVERRTDNYRKEHPSTALLVVEVSDSTLTYDRRTKSGLYASANVPEYWILDLNSRQLEVRRDPASHAMARHGFSYRSLTIYDETQSVSPLLAPEISLRVADLLP